tara:strand:+ start:565 stop:1368 length:804 start_codon:yes stop_codon:yes gene_type:complete
VKEIANGIYCRIDPAGRTNVGFIDCGDGLIFVDTTLFPRTTREAVSSARAISKKPFSYLVNTHYHSDHTFGNQEFSCPIVAHRLCSSLMRNRLPEELRTRIETFPKESKSRLEEVKLTYPSQDFDEEITLDDTHNTTLVHMGGHTPDSLVVALPDEGVIFAGDLLFVGYHPFLIDAEIESWLTGLEKLKGLKAQIIIPGHGFLTDTNEIENMISYLRIFRDNLAKLKKEGYSKEELVTRPEMLSLPSRLREERIAINIQAMYDRTVI